MRGHIPGPLPAGDEGSRPGAAPDPRISCAVVTGQRGVSVDRPGGAGGRAWRGGGGLARPRSGGGGCPEDAAAPGGREATGGGTWLLATRRGSERARGAGGVWRGRRGDGLGLSPVGPSHAETQAPLPPRPGGARLGARVGGDRGDGTSVRWAGEAPGRAGAAWSPGLCLLLQEGEVPRIPQPFLRENPESVRK